MTPIAGCSVVGPSAVRVDRTAYNLSAAQASNDQLLLNLLRLREGEPVYMLELTSVLSQFELNTTAQVGGWWHNMNRIDNNVVNAIFGLDTFATQQSNWGVNAGFVERPTITYTPLHGEKFAKQFMRPISIATLMTLAESGWRIDLIFECCVQRVNDLHNLPVIEFPGESGPDTRVFFELTGLLAERQRAGLLRFDLEADGEEVYIVPYRLPSEDEAVPLRLTELLGLPADIQQIKLVTQSRPGPHEIAIQTRSLLGVMRALARRCEGGQGGEEVSGGEQPQPQREHPRQPPLPWLTVRNSAKSLSDAYVQIRHDGQWHSIADSDDRSKHTFALLVYLSSLSATDIQAGGPVVTVPSH